MNSLTTKLTLSIPKNLIEQAKTYSKSTNQSLSKLVAQFLEGLSVKGRSKKVKLPKDLARLSGIAKNSSQPEMILSKALFKKYGLK